MKIQRGSKVTCLSGVEAFYSGYGSNLTITFSPGMVGTVLAILPKTSVVAGPNKDNRPDFVLVEFPCPTTGKLQKVSLNFCNIRLIRD